jgi:hypothetical protein
VNTQNPQTIISTLLLALAFTAQVAWAQSPLVLRGSVIPGIVTQALNPRKNHNGDRFRLQARQGIIFLGHVKNVTPSHHGHPASMEMVLDTAAIPNRPPMTFHARITALTPSSQLSLTPTSRGAKITGQPGSDLSIKAGTLVSVQPEETLVPPHPAGHAPEPLTHKRSENGGGAEMPF